jgi:hypothetical protein
MNAPETPSPYVPDVVERTGRKLKMEYVGMASIFVIIRFFFFGELAFWTAGLAATAATYFLFLGLKKKTRDHLVTSWLMFASAWLAQAPVIEHLWPLPYLLFAMVLWALEGYVEKRHNRIWLLPVIFGLWASVGASFVLGLVFAATYLLHPKEEKPELRPRLAGLYGASLVAALVVAWLRWDAVFPAGVSGALERIPVGSSQMALLALVGIPTVAALLLYWRRLIHPHRLNTVIFALLAPLDVRLTALFGLVAMVLLAATFFRQSIDSDRFRPWLKHAEWYSFWIYLALAVWLSVQAAQG